jgi:glycosyltransferase involved in cell wall biosynthesis
VTKVSDPERAIDRGRAEGASLQPGVVSAEADAAVPSVAARWSEVTVVVPALDEGPRIGSVVAAIATALPGARIVVVDDGSQDDTAARAREQGAAVLSHASNLGYGAALQTGYRFALRNGYRWVVQLDADGQHPAHEAGRLLEPVLDGRADVAIGSRFVAPSGYAMSRTRTVGRKLLTGLLRLAGGPEILDPTSGYQALSRRAFSVCCEDFFPSDFPDIDVLLTLHRSGLSIVEIPVVMKSSPPGRRAMHSGATVLYYAYKMSLALFRSSWSRPRAGSSEWAQSKEI